MSPRYRTLLALLSVLVLIAVLLSRQRWSPPLESEAQPAIPPTYAPGQLVAELAARLTATPDDRLALLTLADLYAHMDRIDEAIALYERALELDPRDLTARLGFARALLAHGYSSDAEAQLLAALAQEPDNAEALFLLGQCAERRVPPDYAMARSWYERAASTGVEPYARLARQRLAALPVP